MWQSETAGTALIRVFGIVTRRKPSDPTHSQHLAWTFYSRIRRGILALHGSLA